MPHELERTAINCMGFLFVDYKVEMWWFEIVKQLRKLLMTSVIVFFFPGSIHQLAGGIAITLLSLILCLALKPYLRPQHNQLQGVCLTVQLMTLFYGVVLLADNPDSTAPLASNGVSTIVLLINVSVVLVPVAQFWVLRRRPRGGCSVLERLAETFVSNAGRRASTTPQQPRSGRNSLSGKPVITGDVALKTQDPPKGYFLSGYA
jgi:hypothetical protein